MKNFIKWLISVITGLLVVVLLLSVFTMLAGPARIWLTDYFTGYFSGDPRDLPVVAIPQGGDDGMADWATPQEELPHCEFRISGRVTQNDGAPIERAEVKIYNTGVFDSGAYRYTNQDGLFSYSEIGTEICDKEQLYISISKNGFRSHYVSAEPGAELDVSLSFYGAY